MGPPGGTAHVLRRAEGASRCFKGAALPARRAGGGWSWRRCSARGLAAGQRGYNKPEEEYRVICISISHLIFCSKTDQSVKMVSSSKREMVASSKRGDVGWI